MLLTEMLKEKNSIGANLRRKFKLPIKNKALGLIYIKNDLLLEKLCDGLANLPANFVIVSNKNIENKPRNIAFLKKIPEIELLGFDFIVGDSELVHIADYLKNGIVPVIPKNNHMGSVLSDYNPAKSEGNSFLYETENEWNIFYTITRYLENYKFPFDNKSLVKNVFEV